MLSIAEMAVQLDYTSQQSNYYERLVNNQKIARVASFTLESGRHLSSVPVAYKTWGKLNEKCDNVLVICHAMSGSSDAEDWWRPLMGPGNAFDHERFFIICCNQLGSPYGSASPLTLNPETGQQFGPDFPETTIRDDVRIQKLVLDALGVSSVAAVIGGSMGGMVTLEWPLCTPEGYVKTIIAITTSSYQSAWGLSWNEAQREAIMADANYKAGWYDPVPAGQPVQGLGAARMVAMLTYRSYESFESRFHRKLAQQKLCPQDAGLPTPPPSDASSDGEAPAADTELQNPKRVLHEQKRSIPQYAAQSYMQYQAEKFLKRFDANCYISMTHKMDTHDVTRDRLPSVAGDNSRGPTTEDLKLVYGRIPRKALVISVESDVLFRNEHQMLLAECLPEAKFVNLDSPDGHDGFLLEFEALAALIVQQLRELVPWVYDGEAGPSREKEKSTKIITSVFGEAEPEF